jgi:DNA-binding transcriptional ArsR family regulator
MKTDKAGAAGLSREALERTAAVLRVLAHADRLRIVERLETGGPQPVHMLVEALGLAQAAASHHLGRMRAAGLLRVERRGKESWYAIDDARALTILNCIRKKEGGA